MIRIDVTDTRALSDAALFEQWLRRMPAERQEKVNAIRFEKGKRLSLAAGMLLEQALDAAQVTDRQMAYGENGKPYLTAAENVFFNLSHSGHYAVCALSSHDIGVDVEHFRKFRENLIRRVFLPEEVSRIRETYDNPDEGFSALWTVKESVMKFFGTGIRLMPERIRLDSFAPLRVSCEDYDCAALRFAQYPLEDGILTACAAEGEFPERITVMTPE